MMEKFARGIAANLRGMSEAQVKLVLLDAGYKLPGVERADVAKQVKLAEDRIAAFLVQPGARLEGA